MKDVIFIHQFKWRGKIGKVIYWFLIFGNPLPCCKFILFVLTSTPSKTSSYCFVCFHFKARKHDDKTFLRFKFLIVYINSPRTVSVKY